MIGNLRVLFCNAAGPRAGFGHLARSRTIARVLGVPFVVALRGTAATRDAAHEMGATVVPAVAGTVDQFQPHLLVVDDPCPRAAALWVAVARRRGVPVASVHDLGLGRVASDLVIDGSIVSRPSVIHGDLVGPRFAILDPRVKEQRSRAVARVPDRVLVALGGGAHVLHFGAELAFGIVAAVPGIEVVIASGFAQGRRPELPAGGQWIRVTRGLAPELARCAVAVLGGGVTLYEACALGTPTVAVAVVPAQRPTVRAMAGHGVVTDAGSVHSTRAVGRVAASVKRLLTSDAEGPRRSEVARDLVDGHGAFRVARALRILAESGPHSGVHHAPGKGERHAA